MQEHSRLQQCADLCMTPSGKFHSSSYTARTPLIVRVSLRDSALSPQLSGNDRRLALHGAAYLLQVRVNHCSN